MHRLLALFAGFLAFAAPAFAMDMPARKAGLWELKMEFASHNLPPRVMKQCIDAATDKMMNANFGGAAQEACSKRDISKAGNTIVIDSVCKLGAALSTSHAVVSGRFDSDYTVDVTSTRAGTATHMKIAAKWLGPCAAGQRPGDVIMSNGMSMNMLDLQKRAPTKRP
ncbi:MAG: DUF3617 domain-containing protein [Pseudolabrys sp.]